MQETPIRKLHLTTLWSRIQRLWQRSFANYFRLRSTTVSVLGEIQSHPSFNGHNSSIVLRMTQLRSLMKRKRRELRRSLRRSKNSTTCLWIEISLVRSSTRFTMIQRQESPGTHTRPRWTSGMVPMVTTSSTRCKCSLTLTASFTSY